MKRWEEVLEKVAEAFAEVTRTSDDPEASGASSAQDDNCVRFRDDVDKWIRDELPGLVEVIRDVLGKPEEAALVGSLTTIRRNLKKMSSIFSDAGNVRLQQLNSLMRSIVAELQKIEIRSRDQSMSIDGTRGDGLRTFGESVFAFRFRDFQDSDEVSSFFSDTTMDDDARQQVFDQVVHFASHGQGAGPATPRASQRRNLATQDESYSVQSMSETNILHGLNQRPMSGRGNSQTGEGSRTMEMTEPVRGHFDASPNAPADVSRAVSDDGGSRMMSFTTVVPQRSERLPIRRRVQGHGYDGAYTWALRCIAQCSPCRQ
ncbi:hypothetical protein PYCCODRAFT_1060546 [Trametes coccinea BRFM310]|uniref:Uncharacterized protein n=1 Tax=Trametes coccinea (strain BRFM310) TaxID=1353009 RepID=A0A1Y2IZC5_TRAC3|nr:hypothetical protein PYCCODRAFT_1060546 [Trametes coccinea BRFM310]